MDVVRILHAVAWIVIAGLLVGVGHEDVLVQSLHGPVVLGEIPREVIEQFRVRRIHRAQTELING